MLFPVLSILCCTALPVAAVWPKPVQYTTGDGAIWVSSSLVASFQCKGSTLFSSSSHPPVTQQKRQAQRRASSKHSRAKRSSPCQAGHNHTDNDLSEFQIAQDAVHDGIVSIQSTEFVPWKFYTRGANFEPDAADLGTQLQFITIEQTACPSKDALDPHTFFSGNEEYEISVSDDTAHIRSNSTLGTLRALETLKQLVYAHSDSDQTYVGHTPIYVYDKPYWAHRGISLDIARNPYQPRDVRRVIDAMATAKFSRLHIHATDSQSWPLEIPALPELAAKGAYRPSLVWTVADLEDIQTYAAQKGVSAYIEIDLPGHSASVHFAYPELVAAFNETDWSTFALEPESGQLKLNDSRVTNFIDTVFDDLLPRVKKFAPIYHLGGDEFNRNVYWLDETVGTNDTKVLAPLVSKFMLNILAHAQKNNLRPMVWQEMVLEWNVSLPTANSTQPSALVQVWKSSEEIAQVLEKGYPVIFGDYNNWYLDCGQGIFLNPYPSGFSPEGVPYNTSGGAATVIKDPYLDYCNPLKNWRHVYTYNPLQNITAELQHLVEGGEALLWSEQSDGVDVDYKLWPRAAAAGEVLWSGPRNASMIEEASRRLGEWRERAVIDVGVRASPAQMTWCLMEGGCQL